MVHKAAACTVTIPCFNGESVLQDAFDSVQAQSFRDFHLVLVDDASTDGTLALAQELARRHANVSVVALPRNRGRCHARNRGAAEHDSEFVAFLDQDDSYHPEFLAATIDILRQRQEVDAVRVLPEVSVAMAPQQYEAVALSLANTLVLRRKAFEFLGGWPDRPLFREIPQGAEDIALRNLLTTVFTEAVLHRQLYRYSHRPGNALDRFLASSRVENGELVFHHDRELNERIRAELRSLRREFGEKLRELIYRQV